MAIQKYQNVVSNKAGFDHLLLMATLALLSFIKPVYQNILICLLSTKQWRLSQFLKNQNLFWTSPAIFSSQQFACLSFQPLLRSA